MSDVPGARDHLGQTLHSGLAAPVHREARNLAPVGQRLRHSHRVVQLDGARADVHGEGRLQGSGLKQVEFGVDGKEKHIGSFKLFTQYIIDSVEKRVYQQQVVQFSPSLDISVLAAWTE